MAKSKNDKESPGEESEADGFWYKQDKISLYICTECGGLLGESSTECAICGAVMEDESLESEKQVDVGQWECFTTYDQKDSICQNCQIKALCIDKTATIDRVEAESDDAKWGLVSRFRCFGNYAASDDGCMKCDPIVRSFCLDVVERNKKESELLKKTPSEEDIIYGEKNILKKWSNKYGLPKEGSVAELKDALMGRLYPDWEGKKETAKPEEPKKKSLFAKDSDNTLQDCYDLLMEFVKKDEPPSNRTKKKTPCGVRTFRGIGYEFLVESMGYVVEASGDYDKKRALEDAIITNIISQLEGLEKKQYECIAAKAREIFGNESRVAKRIDILGRLL